MTVLLKDFFEYAPDAIIVIDSQGRIVRVNNQAEALFGYDRHKLLGQSVELLLPERFRERHIAYRTAYIAHPRRRPMGASLELFGRRCDGSELPVDIMLSPVTTDGEQLFIAVIRDISERKRAETLLQLQGEIVKNLAEGVYVIRANDGIIVYANPNFEQMFGYEPGELIGQHVSIVNAPGEDGPEATADRIIQSLRLHGRWQGEVRNVKKDGTLFWCYANTSTLEHPEYGTVWVSVHQDITDKKQFEEALQQSEGRFRALFEQSPYALFLNTPDDKIVDVNPAACALVGYSRQELLGMDVADLQAPEVRGWPGQVVQSEWTQGNFIETVNLHQDGHRIPVEVRTIRLDWQDEGLMLSTVRDITERKEAEAQMRASLQEKEVMLKEIHHRVKNNLQIVSSLLKLQAGYAEDPQMWAVLQESRNRVRAMALVHETLYQSKDLASIDFTQYIQQLISHLRKAYGSALSGVVLQVDVEPVRLDLDTAVSCGLIINELVSNALKYAFPPTTDQTGQIDTSLCLDNNDQIKLNVQDNGIGFPADLDFRQTETLGLQLVNTLVVDELEGTIELDRSHGTLFTITLPKPPS